MDQQTLLVRKAAEADEAAIRALVGGERLNPAGLDWTNFLVAETAGRVVGAVRIRKHSDGSRELSSLVIASDKRSQGIASRMIDALLASDSSALWTVTDENSAAAYRHWGFKRVEPCAAPVKVRLNWRIGSIARIISFLRRLPKRRLVILERLPL